MTWFTMYYKTMNVRTWSEKHHEVNFADLSNAKTMARNISTCADVVGNIDIIDGTTGEVMATYSNGEATYVA